jgi:hypothetical protein
MQRIKRVSRSLDAAQALAIQKLIHVTTVVDHEHLISVSDAMIMKANYTIFTGDSGLRLNRPALVARSKPQFGLLY